MSQRPQWTKRVQQFVDWDVVGQWDYAEDGSDDALSDELADAVNAILCAKYGHDIVDDHCGRPEHRYCVQCGKRESTINARDDDHLPTP